MSVTHNALKNSGFTLVEMLVVTSIMGLLSSVVLSSTQSARALARDAQRVQDLAQIKNALELYYDDNGVYPPAPGGSLTLDMTLSVNYGSTARLGTSLPKWFPGWDSLSTYLVPKYIPKLSFDPVNNTILGSCTIPWDDDFLCNNAKKNGYTYIVSLDRQKYDLITILEADTSLMCKNKKWVTNALTFDPSNTWCSTSASSRKIDNLYQANH